jgi:antirestriction protein ArdC
MNVYEVITARILESLEAGTVPWRKPWRTETPKNLISGRDYRGVNVLLLQSTGFASPYWLTFNQARARGGSVKKSERGCPVIFWKVTDEKTARGKREKTFLLRYYTVFNATQTEGIEIPAPSSCKPFDPMAKCEEVVAAYKGGPAIEYLGGQACYVPALDRIRMPQREHFDSPTAYYATLFHELTHSTGAVHRLNRKGVVDPIRFGSHGYALEELVAECGAAFLAAHAGIGSDVVPTSAAYIASWIKQLRNEPRWIVDAAAQASKAADLILGKASQDQEDGEITEGVAA